MNGSLPGYSQGFARSAAEAAEPHWWRGLRTLHVPALGVGGNAGVIRDWSGYKRDATMTAGAAWAQTPEGWGVDTTGGGLLLPEGWISGEESNMFTLVMSWTPNVLAGLNLMYDQFNSRLYLNNKTTCFEYYIGGATVDTSAHGMVVGQPSHIVLTASQDPDHRKVWCDGKLILSSSLAHSWGAGSPSGNAYIGALYTGAYTFKGKITFAAYYTREWSATEAMDFHIDPYRMLRPRERMMGGGAATQPSVLPWWYWEMAAKRRSFC